MPKEEVNKEDPNKVHPPYPTRKPSFPNSAFSKESLRFLHSQIRLGKTLIAAPQHILAMQQPSPDQDAPIQVDDADSSYGDDESDVVSETT